MTSEQDSIKKRGSNLIGADETLLCGICHVKELGEEPVVALSCRHVYHMNCVYKRLLKKWKVTKRVTFTFLDCPVCKKQISLTYEVPKLSELIATTVAEKTQTLEQVRQICIDEGLAEPGSRVATEGDMYHNRHADFLLE